MAGWVMILAAPLILSFSVFKIVSGDTGAVVLMVVVPIVLGAGIWMAGFSTTIRFNTESMTVTRGHIPLFLWWLRKKTISRESATTASVTSHPIFTEMTEYWVEVKTETGKNLVIFKWDEQADADYLLRQIQRWSGQEQDSGSL